MTRTFLILLVFMGCQSKNTGTASSQLVSNTAYSQSITTDTLMNNIQVKIKDAFVQGIMSKETKKMDELKTDLAQLQQQEKHKLIQYWQAYLQYYASIYYLQAGNNEQSEKEVDQGISWMKAMSNKDAEDYALLAMLQSFGIQFKGMRAMFISSSIKKNVKKALAMDPENLRAHFVYASNDYYTPAKYGGGKEAETYLLKALKLPIQKTKNDKLPSWGMEEAYEMLIKLYMKQEKWDSAKQYYAEGSKTFPSNYSILQLGGQLVNK